MATFGDNEQPALSPHREPTLTRTSNSDDEMFSPTSAAALALSTLHHFGDQQRPSAASMKATRLFNASETQEPHNEIAPQYYPNQPTYHPPHLHPSYYGHFGMWSRGNPNTPQTMASVQVSPWSYPYPSPTGYQMEVSTGRLLPHFLPTDATSTCPNLFHSISIPMSFRTLISSRIQQAGGRRLLWGVHHPLLLVVVRLVHQNRCIIIIHM